MSATETDAQNSWRFAQCFGDKGEVEDITEGESSYLPCGLPTFGTVSREESLPLS